MKNIESLQILSYRACKKNLTNDIKFIETIPKLLMINYHFKIENMQNLIKDIFGILKKKENILTEFVYNIILKFVDKFELHAFLLNYKNNSYLENSFLQKILTIDLVAANIKYENIQKNNITDMSLLYNVYNFKNEEEVVNYNYKDNFNKYTNNIFVEINYDNMIFAGGLINKIINKNFEYNFKNGYYDGSDIDIFLYGTVIEKKNKIIYIINFLYEKLGEYYIINYSNIIKIYFINYHKEIQIIIGYYLNPLQIINDFDLSHLQLYYDGNSIFGTINTYNALKNQESLIMKNKINKKLAYKTFKSGFSIKYDYKNDIYLNNTIIDSFLTLSKNQKYIKKSLFYLKNKEKYLISKNRIINKCFNISNLESLNINYYSDFNKKNFYNF